MSGEGRAPSSVRVGMQVLPREVPVARAQPWHSANPAAQGRTINGVVAPFGVCRRSGPVRGVVQNGGDQEASDPTFTLRSDLPCMLPCYATSRSPFFGSKTVLQVLRREDSDNDKIQPLQTLRQQSAASKETRTHTHIVPIRVPFSSAINSVMYAVE